MSKTERRLREHVWTVLCSKAIAEENTRKLSLIDLPERLTLRDPELLSADQRDDVALGLRFVLASMFWCDGPSMPLDYRVNLRWPNGKRSPNQRTVSIPGSDDAGSARILTNIEAIQFRGLGIYYFEVSTRSRNGRWRRVAKVPLQVLAAEDQRDQPAEDRTDQQRADQRAE